MVVSQTFLVFDDFDSVEVLGWSWVVGFREEDHRGKVIFIP